MPENNEQEEPTSSDQKRTMPIRFLVRPAVYVEWETAYLTEKVGGTVHSREDFIRLLIAARRAQKTPYDKLVS